MNGNKQSPPISEYTETSYGYKLFFGVGYVPGNLLKGSEERI